jgi:ATP-binding cassette subfamily B (MDR/TAP) protein 1
LASFNALLHKNISFFDREEYSTGALTAMLADDAAAMSDFTGLGLGAILTVSVGLISGTIVA